MSTAGGVRPYPWWLGPASWLGARFLRLVGRTWRIERVGTAEFDAVLDRGQRCIFAIWHARLLPLVYTHRDRGISMLVSRHRDGELIARVIEALGFTTARGSSTRGGEEGMLEMREWAERGHLLGFTPDGPRGPAQILKPGVVYLASRLGLPIVPVASSSRPERRLASWDGFRIPFPFARVVVAYGVPIAVPADLDRGQLETWRLEVERAITNLTHQVDARAERGAKADAA